MKKKQRVSTVMSARPAITPIVHRSVTPLMPLRSRVEPELLLQPEAGSTAAPIGHDMFSLSGSA
jgi:hypothetical protein